LKTIRILKALFLCNQHRQVTDIKQKIDCYKQVVLVFTRCLEKFFANKGTGIRDMSMLLPSMVPVHTEGIPASVGERAGIYTSIMGNLPVFKLSLQRITGISLKLGYYYNHIPVFAINIIVPV
jgi:hypothetical protein